MPRICLNMIVRDEAAVIERCLASVRPLVDAWLVVDTGSTDGTQALIRSLLGDLPGELVERPWVDFAHNRNQALELAKPRADHLLIIDADEVLHLDPGFALPDPLPDALRIRHYCSGSPVAYDLPKLVRASLPWRWHGVVHEYLACATDHGAEVGERIHIVGHFDGARNRDPRRKYLADAALLERSLAEDPGNLRDLFYLAQSLRDAGETRAAIERYRQRAEAGGWEEERWYARFQVAVLSERAGRPRDELVTLYDAAHRERQTRAEPLCDLARLAREAGDFEAALHHARAASALPRPADTLFVDETANGWRARAEGCTALFWLGRVDEAIAGLRRLLVEETLPAAEAARVRAELALAERRRAWVAALRRGRAPAAVAELTVTITACRRPALLRRMLQSLRANCKDSDEVGRWLCMDDGTPEAELAALAADVPWLEIHRTPEDDRGHASAIRRLWTLASSPWILHLEDDWLFPEPFRLADVLAHAEGLDQLLFRSAPQEEGEERRVELTAERRRVLVACGAAPAASATDHPWPGFSLNPSLLNRKRAVSLLDPMPGGSDFEFECSVRLRAAGFEVRAYPLNVFHQGGTSAYVLSGRPRRSDRPALVRELRECCAADPARCLELGEALPLGELPAHEACFAGLSIATAWWYVDRDRGRRYLAELFGRLGPTGFLFSLDAAELLAFYEEGWASLQERYGSPGALAPALAPVARPDAGAAPITVPDLRGGSGVTLAMTSCRRLPLWRRTLASFLACCSDHAVIDRWICIDDNSSLEDRREMARAAPWMEFVCKGPEERGHAQSLQRLHAMIDTPYVFLLEDDQEFFEADAYIERCLHGLSFGTSIGQCLVNRNYAEGPEDADLAGGMAFRHAGRPYLAHLRDPEERVVQGRSSAWWPHFSLRPGITRLDAWDDGFEAGPGFEYEFASRYAARGWLTVFLPGIHHAHIGRRVGAEGENAYSLNRVRQF